MQKAKIRLKGDYHHFQWNRSCHLIDTEAKKSRKCFAFPPATYISLEILSIHPSLPFIEVVDVAKCGLHPILQEAGNCVKAMCGQDGFYVDCAAAAHWDISYDNNK